MAHEDRDRRRSASDDSRDRRTVPAGFAERPAPDPAMFGLPTEDDGSRTDPLVGQNMISTTHFEPDVDALRAAPTRIVLAVGATSGATLAGRAALVIAEQLGTAPVVFPGGHDGFLGGEYGQTGEPDAFAARLREVIDSSSTQLTPVDTASSKGA